MSRFVAKYDKNPRGYKWQIAHLRPKNLKAKTIWPKILTLEMATKGHNITLCIPKMQSYLSFDATPAMPFVAHFYGAPQ